MSVRQPAPWLRSSSEPVTPRGERRLSAGEAVAILVVVIAVLAMAVWFVLLARGGIGPGTI